MSMYYKLDDGRVWDVLDACFVEEIPEPCDWLMLAEAAGGPGDEGCLRRFLRSSGRPLGELQEDEDFAVEVRAERNRLLAASDYLAMPDYPLSEGVREAVLLYRQALRDVTDQEGFPRSVVWPEKPLELRLGSE